jgi:hypothetical protein
VFTKMVTKVVTKVASLVRHMVCLLRSVVPFLFSSSVVVLTLAVGSSANGTSRSPHG